MKFWYVAVDTLLLLNRKTDSALNREQLHHMQVGFPHRKYVEDK